MATDIRARVPGGLTAIRAVASHAIRQWVRSRIVLVSVGAGGAVVTLALLLGPLLQVDPERLVADLGLAVCELSGLLIVLLVSALGWVDETERRTLSLVLVKPVTRTQILLGNYAGACAVLAVSTGAIALCTLGGAVLAGGGPWTRSVLPSAALLWVELCVLQALAVLLLQGATSLVAAVLYPLGAFVLGAFSPTLRYVAEHTDDPVLHAALSVLRVLVPNFELFALKNEPGFPAAGHLLPALGYAVLYASVALSAAVLAFRRREA